MNVFSMLMRLVGLLPQVIISHLLLNILILIFIITSCCLACNGWCYSMSYGKVMVPKNDRFKFLQLPKKSSRGRKGDNFSGRGKGRLVTVGSWRGDLNTMAKLVDVHNSQV